MSVFWWLISMWLCFLLGFLTCAMFAMGGGED